MSPDTGGERVRLWLEKSYGAKLDQNLKKAIVVGSPQVSEPIYREVQGRAQKKTTLTGSQF